MVEKNVETAVLDEETEKRVQHDTTTRERQSRSKRAHEPVDMADADEQQPVEDDNGPRLPEVNAAESAKVEDPTQRTQSLDNVSGETKKPTVANAKK